jgi:hypothetical protein
LVSCFFISNLFPLFSTCQGHVMWSPLSAKFSTNNFKSNLLSWRYLNHDICNFIFWLRKWFHLIVNSFLIGAIWEPSRTTSRNLAIFSTPYPLGHCPSQNAQPPPPPIVFREEITCQINLSFCNKNPILP